GGDGDGTSGGGSASGGDGDGATGVGASPQSPDKSSVEHTAENDGNVVAQPEVATNANDSRKQRNPIANVVRITDTKPLTVHFVLEIYETVDTHYLSKTYIIQWRSVGKHAMPTNMLGQRLAVVALLCTSIALSADPDATTGCTYTLTATEKDATFVVNSTDPKCQWNITADAGKNIKVYLDEDQGNDGSKCVKVSGQNPDAETNYDEICNKPTQRIFKAQAPIIVSPPETTTTTSSSTQSTTTTPTGEGGDDEGSGGGSGSGGSGSGGSGSGGSGSGGSGSGGSGSGGNDKDEGAGGESSDENSGGGTSGENGDSSGAGEVEGPVDHNPGSSNGENSVPVQSGSDKMEENPETQSGVISRLVKTRGAASEQLTVHFLLAIASRSLSAQETPAV
ncbi:unnamed protein product, partial [Echinostoma caproni]|uniref:CUB domain-containing protein n=1 Tax=Echinostoma caproni TaxID=27848 RepID=A0A183AFW5_9TREM